MVEEEEIAKCGGYKYLRVHLTEGDRNSLEIRNWIAQGKKAIRRLKRIW